MTNTLIEKWLQVSEHGMSSDQVRGILYAWRADRNELSKEIKKLRAELEDAQERINELEGLVREWRDVWLTDLSTRKMRPILDRTRNLLAVSKATTEANNGK